MITWRTELYFDCDNCSNNLCLDRIDAKTKRGMFKIAKEVGWTWTKEKKSCLCPKCSNENNNSILKKV